MKYKTLFRLLVKLLGVYFLTVGIGYAIYGIGFFCGPL